MSKIKLTGHASGSGTITLTGPNTNSDRTITLPDATGTALMTDGSAASLTNVPAANITGTLPAIDGSSLTGMSVGLYASVAVITDQKTSGTAGGTFTVGAWRTRDLNTEVSDADGIVSITSNQFTLAAGTYTIDWIAPAYKVGRHVSRLYNASDSTSITSGSHTSSNNNDNTNTHSFGSTVITIAGSKAFEIQHQCEESYTTYGFGVEHSFDVTTYSLVKILKHS